VSFRPHNWKREEERFGSIYRKKEGQREGEGESWAVARQVDRKLGGEGRRATRDWWAERSGRGETEKKKSRSSVNTWTSSVTCEETENHMK
jgi:hypothetical protein